MLWWESVQWRGTGGWSWWLRDMNSDVVTNETTSSTWVISITCDSVHLSVPNKKIVNRVRRKIFFSHTGLRVSVADIKNILWVRRKISL